jgi:ABC-type branched-subunit amino acid transport system ATPase component
VHDPPLLVLDEPLSGTDPAQRLHLRDVIRALAAEGRTILVSSLLRSLPAFALELGVRLPRVEPLDDSLESVFEYLATGSGR